MGRISKVQTQVENLIEQIFSRWPLSELISTLCQRVRSRIFLLFFTTIALTGCVSESVRVVDMTPPNQLSTELDESELLDVGITIFDPNIPHEYDEQVKKLIQPDIRRAESNYMPYYAKNLLQSTGNWGAVRVIPQATHAVDVIIEGKIIHSDGESLIVRTRVTDATGKTWFSKEYKALASKYAYTAEVPETIDPFQSIYKQIANDMLAYRKKLTPNQIIRIRRTAEMQFAREFSPEAFSDYITEKSGRSILQRLPTADDPMLIRVRKIREREYLFIDTLDEYYENFHRQVHPPYHEWRKATYDEAIMLKQLKKQARNRTIGGLAAIVAGVAAMTESSNPYIETAGLVSVVGGAVTLKSAIEKRAEAAIHSEVLQEVGEAAQAEISPYTLDLENQTIRLQGSVEEQYDQLRKILKELYLSDLDLVAPQAN